MNRRRASRLNAHLIKPTRQRPTKKQPEPTYKECRWYYKKLTSDTMTQHDLLELAQGDPHYAGYLLAQHYPAYGACIGLLLYCKTFTLFDQFLEGYRNGRESLMYNQRAFGHLYRVDPPPEPSEEALESTYALDSH